MLYVTLYNRDPESSRGLKEQIDALNFVRFLGEVNNPDDLNRCITESGANLVFFHLDPEPGPVVELIDQISARFREVAMIAISSQTDPSAIIAPMRAGCDQFVARPIDPTDLTNAVARVASKRLAQSTESRCTCVVAPSGGSGATAIACNLAMELGQLSDRQCALVDLNLQFGGVALNFDAEAKSGLADLAGSLDTLDRSLIESAMIHLPCKISILARLQAVEQEESITPDLIHRVVEILSTSYENIVIDLPGQLNAKTMAALAAADCVLVICQMLVPSIQNAKRYADALAHAGMPPDRIEFVANRVETKNTRITLEQMEETVQKPLFGAVPNDYHFMARTIDFGRPIAAINANNPIRAAIREVAEKLVSGRSISETRPSRGFLSRLFS